MKRKSFEFVVGRGTALQRRLIKELEKDERHIQAMQTLEGGFVRIMADRQAAHEKIVAGLNKTIAEQKTKIASLELQLEKYVSQ